VSGNNYLDVRAECENEKTLLLSPLLRNIL